MNEKNITDLLQGTNLQLEEKLNTLFKEFPDFFNKDSKKAIFLEGVLAQYLLNIQYNDRKATPFRVKLQGLKLDEKHVKKLLPEIQTSLKNIPKPDVEITLGDRISLNILFRRILIFQR